VANAAKIAINQCTEFLRDKTAIVGGLADNRISGAAWVYSRSGGVSTIAETELHTYRSASTPLKSCVSMHGR
jgi:hypothetical protein